MAQIPARGDCSRQLTRKQAGDAWEAAARRWLESKGLRFIAANVRERGGEIDLIMRDGKRRFLLRSAIGAPGFMAARRLV